MLNSFPDFDNVENEECEISVTYILNTFNVYFKTSCPNTKLILKHGDIE